MRLPLAAVAFAAAVLALPLFASPWQPPAPADAVPAVQRVRPKFMTFSGARWKQGTIRWYYNPAGSPVPAATVVATAQAAFAQWSGACDVRFVYGGLTDAQPLVTDGAMVLAWSPLVGGNSGVAWVDIVSDTIVDADVGLNAALVGVVAPLDALLLHEIGHALGLNHSDVAGSVMAGPPFTPYTPWERMRTLTTDDIAGCQALFGPAPGVAAVLPALRPVCTIALSDPSPAVGRTLAVTAHCSGAPYRYHWSGCAQPRDRYCLDEAGSPGPRTYTVAATNTGGTGLAASATATWVDVLPSCTIAQAPAGPAHTGLPVQLVASCDNAPVRFRWRGCTPSGATCTAVQAVPGAAEYAVVAGNAAGDGPPARATLQWIAAAPWPACGGFADVGAADPFCADVDWLANRGVTQGCAPGLYCGQASVSRMQMALFLARLGAALTPVRLHAGATGSTFASGSVACATMDHPAAWSARAGIVRARLTGTTPGDAVVRIAPVASFDAGASWSYLATIDGAAAAFAPAPAATVNDYAAVDLAPGAVVRFGLRVEGPASVTGTCALDVELFDRERDAAPW